LRSGFPKFGSSSSSQPTLTSCKSGKTDTWFSLQGDYKLNKFSVIAILATIAALVALYLKELPFFLGVRTNSVLDFSATRVSTFSSAAFLTLGSETFLLIATGYASVFCLLEEIDSSSIMASSCDVSSIGVKSELTQRECPLIQEFKFVAQESQNIDSSSS
jgi:hypothetical protein